MANHLKGLKRQTYKAPGRFAGSTACERYTPNPDDPKTCASCHKQKLCKEFGPRKKSPDGLDYYCHDCRAARGKAVYHFRKDKIARDRWKRLRGDTLLAFAEELLNAAQDAATKGLWRGPEGMQAYKRLILAVRLFQRPSEEEADVVDLDVEECICPQWPCPRHVDEVADPGLI